MSRTPSFERITEVVARSLGLTSSALRAGFQPAVAAQVDAVVALRRVIFGADMPAACADADYLRWRYRFGDPRRGRGDCWVLVLAGAVIAMTGTEELRIREDATEISAWSTMDIAVHPEFAGVGLGAWMNLMLCEHAGAALTIGSNRESRSMISRTFNRLPDRRSYIHVLRFDSLSARHLPNPQSLRLLARIAAALLDLLERGFRFWVFSRNDSALELKPIERFDAQVEALVARASPRGERRTARSVTFLNWRLFDNPRVRYRVIGAYRSNELVGFLATQVKFFEGQRRSLLLIDWLVDQHMFEPVLRTLCGHAMREAIAINAESVTVTAYHAQTEHWLRRWGFVLRPNAFETLAVASTDPATLAWLLAPANWFLTEANTDRDAN